METSRQMKESMIQNYINSIDFTGEISVSKIKADLRSILHETPAVDVKYVREKLITEDSRKNKIEIVDEKIKSIIIAFSDGEDSNQRPIVHRVEFFK